MKRISLLLAATLLLAGTAIATEYVWSGGATGDYTATTNWTPERTTPAVTDDLVINTDAVITNLQSETIASLTITGGAEVIFEASTASRTLEIDGGPDSFLIDTDSSLRLRGTTSVALRLRDGTTGEIRGDLIFNALAGSVVMRIRVDQANGLRVKDGGSTAMAPTGTGAASGFGDSVANSIVFESGSTHYQGGEKDGTFNGGSGTNPYVLTGPAQIPVFEPGSTYHVNYGFPNLVQRRTAHFVGASHLGNYALGTCTPVNEYQSYTLKAPLKEEFVSGNFGTSSAVAGDSFVISDFFSVLDGGPMFIMTGAPTDAQNLKVGGNVTVENPANLYVDNNVNRFLVLNGSAAQTVDANWSVVQNLTLDNAAGANLVSPLAVLNAVDLTDGVITASGNGALLVSSAVTVPPSYTGPVGAAERIDVAAVGTTNLVLADAPVSFEVTAAGTGAIATIMALTSNSAAAGLPANYAALDRVWDIRMLRGSGFTGTLVLTYDAGDVPGGVNEDELAVLRLNGAEWEVVPATIDSVAKTATIEDVTEFSQWTLAEPLPPPPYVIVDGPQGDVYDKAEEVLELDVAVADLINGLSGTILAGGFHSAAAPGDDPGRIAALTDGTFNANGLTGLLADTDGSSDPSIEIEYALPNARVDEIRIFSGHIGGSASRVFINCVVEVDKGSGYEALGVIKTGDFGTPAPTTGSAVAFARMFPEDLDGVQKIKFLFHNVSHSSSNHFQAHDDNTTNPPANYPNQGSIIKEIDVIGEAGPASVNDWMLF